AHVSVYPLRFSTVWVKFYGLYRIVLGPCHGLCCVLRPPLAHVENLPKSRPRRDHRIVRLDFKGLINETAGVLVFSPLHAVYQRNRKQQQACRPIALPTLRLTLDKKNYRIDLPDDPRRHQFVNAMQFAGAQFKAIVPNRASAIGHVEQSHADLEAPPIARERSIDDVVELAPLQQRLAREGNRG